MSFIKADKIWFDGKMVNWDEAKIHVLSHVIHYGTGSFEGIRLYEMKNGKSAIFRLHDHAKRLLSTCKIYNMIPTHTLEELEQAIIETVKVNRLKSGYIRPIVFRGYDDLGVLPLTCPIQTVIAVWEWPAYFSSQGTEKGIKIFVSSWSRPSHNSFPSSAKGCGQYLNAQLIRFEAHSNGFDEAVALDVNGYLSEGSGNNIFLVSKGRLITPASHNSILVGITRETVFSIAKQLSIDIEERSVNREEIYSADEIFITGTATEITPVVAVGNYQVGNGKKGVITTKLQKKFYEIVLGEEEDKFGWLTAI